MCECDVPDKKIAPGGSLIETLYTNRGVTHFLKLLNVLHYINQFLARYCPAIAQECSISGRQQIVGKKNKKFIFDCTPNLSSK